jgi:hypothetical protein
LERDLYRVLKERGMGGGEEGNWGIGGRDCTCNGEIPGEGGFNNVQFLLNLIG